MVKNDLYLCGELIQENFAERARRFSKEKEHSINFSTQQNFCFMKQLLKIAPPLICNLQKAFIFVILLFATKIEAQTPNYHEQFSTKTKSRVLTPDSANPNNWNEMEKTDARPWEVAEQTEKQVNADGTFFIKINHSQDTRFRLPNQRPKQTIIDQNGFRVIGLQNQIIVNEAYAGTFLSQFPETQIGFPIASIGQFPDFHTFSAAEIVALQAQGWTVTTLPNSQLEMTRSSTRITIANAWMKYTTEFLVENQVQQKLEMWYRLDSLNQIVPFKTRETEYKTMSNGDCIHRETLTQYLNYLVQRNAVTTPRMGEKEPFLVINSRILPNPVSNELNLTWQSSTNSVQITIFDQVGKIVRRLPNQVGSSLRLDVNNFVPGLYNVTIQGESGRETLRFVKH
jgi:Secretion system C-terminal sorting domain